MFPLQAESERRECACAMWQAYHNRDYLIAKYGKSLIFDVFKMVLTVSCDREVDFTTVYEGAEKKVTSKVRLKIKPNAEGKTLIPWDDENQGAGVLDAKKLLEQELPTAEDLYHFIAQENERAEEKRAEEEKEKERKLRAHAQHIARAVRFHGLR